ncbi:hypothetical protein [Lysinibacillus sp. BW-2-10]|nr:hypothetical protein [Lysinibacillus sp. BW-2-10]TSI08683.1 hypothetical protein FJQ64_06970 [Lysinibacillus sp. BW-2-10]
MPKHKGIKLRYIISILVLFAIISTTFVNMYTSNLLFQETLSEKYLNKNYEYAQKIAYDTTLLIDELEKNIKNLASTIGSEDFD